MSYGFDLGPCTWPITTQSAKAQKWFDRGLMWTYGFNHEEAIACYQKALEIDADCAMAHWGVAYVAGCNYNKPWDVFDPEDAALSVALAYENARMAAQCKAALTAKERSLIDALTTRYPVQKPNSEMSLWNDNYASALRGVYQDHGDDLNVATLFSEAMMNRTSWDLWDLKTGEPTAGADTQEIKAVLEKAMGQAGGMAHPGVLHMYIHLMEMSPMPEMALKAGDALRGLVPDAGHLNHMPTHIDVLCGHYEAVVTSNDAAISADTNFLNRFGALNFYSLYRCHNYHFKVYGAMFLGQYHTALEAAEDMVATLPEALLEMQSPPMADWLEAFVSIKQHVLIRFGKWQDIIDQPLPDNQDLFCVTTAMVHYAKTVAYAASGKVALAEAELVVFKKAVKRVKETRFLFNISCIDILAIGREMALGEIAYRKENCEDAFEHLRKSVELSDNLTYDEPWGWMQPARNALGALLLERGQVEEAAQVYRADLGYDDSVNRACQHPDNVWSLFGYHDCLVQLGRKEEAIIIKQRLDLANGRTDVVVKSSCFCKLGSH